MRRCFILLCAVIVCLSITGCEKTDTDTSSLSYIYTDNVVSHEADQAEPEFVEEAVETACLHQNTKIINHKNATCIAEGYAGDVICSECNELIKEGSVVAKTSTHNPETRNFKKATSTSTGYSGDTYCKDCGVEISKGEITPFEVSNDIPMRIYTAPSGRKYTVPEGTDILDYTISLNPQPSVKHQLPEVEQEIVRLCNEERAKIGVAPLTWYEPTYSLVKTRAEESFISYSHTRPNGADWMTVYRDKDILNEFASENMMGGQFIEVQEIAKEFVESWMNSTKGHREAILNPEHTRITVALVMHEDTKCYGIQHFYT